MISCYYCGFASPPFLKKINLIIIYVHNCLTFPYFISSVLVISSSFHVGMFKALPGSSEEVAFLDT